MRYDPPELPGPRPNIVPGQTGIEVVLGKSRLAKVLVSDVLAYPNGMQMKFSYSVANSPPFEEYGFPNLGVEYPNGKRFTTDSLIDQATPWDPSFYVLMQGGRGTPTGMEWTYWIQPLPEPGPIMFSCSWRRCGIEPRVVEIDADVIREASKRARPS